MIDTQELRDRTLEAAAEKIHQTVERITWEEAMDAARAVVELPAIEALPVLVEEHERWASAFGMALMLALQADYSEVDTLAHDLRIGFPDGAPAIVSDALTKLEGVTA